jgi:hypothetical protein
MTRLVVEPAGATFNSKSYRQGSQGMGQQPTGLSVAPEQQSKSYAQDEIDLVGLGAALLRRWKLILAVVVVCTVLGLIAALLKQPSYGYKAAIQLAAYTTTDGHTVRLLSPQSASALLQNGLVDTAVTHYADAHKLDARKLKIDVQTSKDSDVVVLSGKGPLALQPAFVSVEKAAASLLAQHASAQIEAYKANIQAELNHAKIDLAKLQDPQRIAAAKAALKQAWLAAQAKLANLEQQHGVLQKKQAGLDQSVKLYKGLAKDLSGYLAKARRDGLSSARAATPTQAMTAMLLGNQIQQNLSQLTNIDRQLSVILPQQIAETEAALANNTQQQLSQQAVVERTKLDYQNFDAQHARDVQAQQISINKLHDQLNNIQGTQLVDEPVRSIQPVGLSRKAIVILAFLAGIFLALLAAGAAGYWDAVRRAMKSA